MVRVTDCKTEGAGSIPDGIATVYALLRRLAKHHWRFFARTLYGSLERVPPRTISQGFYPETLKVPAERWAEEPFKVLLRTFFPESVGTCVLTSSIYISSVLYYANAVKIEQ